MSEPSDWTNEKGSDASMDPAALEHAKQDAADDEPKFGEDVHLDDE